MTREELLHAVEENPESYLELLARHTPGATFRRSAQLRTMCLGVPVPFLNGVAMGRLSVNDDAQIKGAIGEMNATGMPWSWQIGPLSTPFDLHIRLNNSGMQPSHEMPLMVNNLSTWKPSKLPPQFAIEEVTHKDSYLRFLEVAGIAFGLPQFVLDVFKRAQSEIGFGEDAPVRNFLGLDKGEPVSTGTVFYDHGVAGVFTIGTPPEHRGKGFGTAVTEACLFHARQRGVGLAMLQSSRMGRSVYERIGFQEIGQIGVYVPTEP